MRLPDYNIHPHDPAPDVTEEQWAEASENIRAKHGFGRALWAKRICERYESQIEAEVERLEDERRREMQIGGWESAD